MNLWGHTCHALSYLDQDYIIAIGGYGPGPNTIQKDSEIINNSKICKHQNTIHHLIRTNNQWSEHWMQYNSEITLQGHASCMLNPTTIGVFGGKSSHDALHLYSLENKSISSANVNGIPPCSRWDHSFDFYCR